VIKESDLVPGNVIASVDRRWTRNGEPVRIIAWVVIGFITLIKRRHSRSSAPKDGWHVLLLRFGKGDRVLHDVIITSSDMTSDWKRLF
jgi:hypothetical protein